MRLIDAWACVLRPDRNLVLRVLESQPVTVEDVLNVDQEVSGPSTPHRG